MAKKHDWVVLNPELYQRYIDQAVKRTKEYIRAELGAIRLIEETDAANMLLKQLNGRVKKVVECVADFYLYELEKWCKKKYFLSVSDSIRKEHVGFSHSQNPFHRRLGTSLENLADDISNLH